MNAMFAAKLPIIFSCLLWLIMLRSASCDSPTQLPPDQLCALETLNYEDIKCLSSSVLYVFQLDIYNLREDHVKIYKPWKYYTTSSTHGMTLLSLSFNYDVLSLTLLTIGVKTVYVELHDYPQGCFGDLSPKQQVHMIRKKAFDKFSNDDYIHLMHHLTDNTENGNSNEYDYTPPDYDYERTYDDNVQRYNRKDYGVSMTTMTTTHTSTERNDTLHRNTDDVDQQNKAVDRSTTDGTLDDIYDNYDDNNSTKDGTVNDIYDNYGDNNDNNSTSVDYPDYYDSGRCKDAEKPDMYVCNEIIRNRSGYAEFTNVCCTRNLSDTFECSEQDGNMWITVLYVCIGVAKITILLFSPVFIPEALYLKLIRKYVVKFKQQFKMKVYLGDSATPPVRYKNATTWNNVAKWPQFANNLEHIPKNKVCSLELKDAIIEVQGSRIIKANYPPAGLVRTLYDNFVRCRISRTDPFRSCCNTSVYPCVKQTYTWKAMIQPCVRIIGYFIVPLPLLVRLYIYYKYEKDELSLRHTTIENRGLKTKYQPFRMNFIQYLSPTNGLLITLYAFQVFAVLLFIFAGKTVRTKLNSIVQSALFDMKSVSRTSVLALVLKYILWFFKEYGCLALLMLPVLLILAVPLCACICILYSVPTIYLSFRLVYHCKRTFGGVKPFSWSEKTPSYGKNKIKKIRVGLAKLDEKAHVPRKTFIRKTEYNPAPQASQGCSKLHRFILQVGFSVFFLTILYSILLFLVDTIGMAIEVLVFTLMGLVVNAEDTLKYFSLAVLVLVYMRKSYHTVYKLYLQLNASLIDHVIKRTEDLSQVASLPSSVQENVAFQMKTIETMDEIPTTFFFKKPQPCLNIGHLVLFFDSHDTPRIPVNFFRAACNICVYGAPGPVYVNLLRATAKFGLIMAFLTFLMVIIMAFGNAYELSQTHQFLATVAGGALPMLMDFLPATKASPLELDTLSFEGQVDEVIADYKQNWPILDLIVKETDIRVKDEPTGSSGTNGVNVNTNQEEVPGYNDTIEQQRAQFISKNIDDNDNDHPTNMPYGSKQSSMVSPAQVANTPDIPVDEMVDLYIDVSSNECAVPCEGNVKDGDDTATEMITM